MHVHKLDVDVFIFKALKWQKRSTKIQESSASPHFQHPQYLLYCFPGQGSWHDGVTLTKSSKKRATQSLQNPLKNIKESVWERKKESSLTRVAGKNCWLLVIQRKLFPAPLEKMVNNRRDKMKKCIVCILKYYLHTLCFRMVRTSFDITSRKVAVYVIAVYEWKIVKFLMNNISCLQNFYVKGYPTEIKSKTDIKKFLGCQRTSGLYHYVSA